MTQGIKDESYRAYALSELAKHLPAELWPEALSVTRGVKDESYRAYALGELVKHLPAEGLPEALSMMRRDQGCIISCFRAE